MAKNTSRVWPGLQSVIGLQQGILLPDLALLVSLSRQKQQATAQVVAGYHNVAGLRPRLP